MKRLEYKKKLSSCIERVKIDGITCVYVYEFKNKQWLENMDDMDYLDANHKSIKENFIEHLVDDFRSELNLVVFGDVKGKKNEYNDNWFKRLFKKIKK